MTESEQHTPLPSRGFSALELMVVLGVAGIFSLVLYSFYHFHTYALKAQDIAVGLREGSRLALDFLVREVPLAGARPVRESPCEGFERLTQATDQRLAFQYDYRANSAGSPPDGCPDDPNERIVYLYDSDAQVLKRGTGGGAPQPLINDVPPDGFLIQYFDRDGINLGASLTAAQREAVTSLVVTVRTSKPHPNPTVATPLTSELRSTIFLPNPPR
ncbi:MAG: prepilin-type N-terminal cleavage/methylation domain-containing protein [Deltaproteobacteria bacterium]|nr:prepilin-type N-terminal cleavage/methylation domain-containing protein [Deltaproteobacteria bacterium]